MIERTASPEEPIAIRAILVVGVIAAILAVFS
jgi:hypothetical protein